MLRTLFFFNTVAFAQASLDWSIMEFSLLVLPGKKNCNQGCSAVGLDCFNDIIDINTLSEEFVLEWFYLFGMDKFCTIKDIPRGLADQPSIRVGGMRDNCWKPANDQKLSGPVIAVHEDTEDVSRCARLCQRNLQCLTANYKHATKECELLPKHAERHQSDVITESGVDMLVRQLNDFVHY